MITKPEEHENNRAGKRLLREVVEPLGWVINDTQEDYGIDSNVQLFDGGAPTGAWFHVQLKSSASSPYSADGAFISQEFLVQHARHYALEVRDPVFVVHADVTARKVYWYAPQLDRHLTEVASKTGAKFVTVRIPTRHTLPDTAPNLLKALDDIYLVLANRELATASAQSFAECLNNLPGQEAMYVAFQEKSATLKLQMASKFFGEKKFAEAKSRAESVINDPDATIETKFWARIQLEAVEFTETVRAGKPQVELHRVLLTNAKQLQRLTASGPKHLKFYSLIARRAAELGILAHEDLGLHMALQQHVQHRGSPMMALSIFVRRAALTNRILSKYNQCVRLARYAANYANRWALGRALSNVAKATGPYFITLRSERRLKDEQALAQSVLQICKLAVHIGAETGDTNSVVMTILGALMTTDTEDSEAYRWAEGTARGLRDDDVRADALLRIERAKKRWKGELVEGDYKGDTTWQAIQNMAAALGVDLSDEKSPIVRGLRIAAKDDSPERVLRTCEHILVSRGATGPAAREIERLFNIATAGSKVVHCTLHNFHHEGKELNEAYGQFRVAHCESCPDRTPRSDNWRYNEEFERTIDLRHAGIVAALAGTPYGLRYTSED